MSVNAAAARLVRLIEQVRALGDGAAVNERLVAYCLEVAGEELEGTLRRLEEIMG